MWASLISGVYMYDIQIRKLEFIIENWGLIKVDKNLSYYSYIQEFGGGIYFNTGLCENCNLYDLDIALRLKMFESFPKYSGYKSLPLKNFENHSTMRDFTHTPERLELAIHCLEYLKGLQNESKN
jgi:hypothetical protein